MERVTIGQISRARGLKGEMVVVPLTDDLRRFLQLQRVKVSTKSQTKEFEVEGAREFKGKVLLQLRDVDSRDEATKLVGGFIQIERDEAVKLPQGSYFISDLIGLEVLTTQGERIGKIKEVISLPANDVYVVEGEARHYDIPAIKEIVKKIDLAKGEMIIEPLPGLLEI